MIKMLIISKSTMPDKSGHISVDFNNYIFDTHIILLLIPIKGKY